jgi:hypothetical protein
MELCHFDRVPSWGTDIYVRSPILGIAEFITYLKRTAIAVLYFECAFEDLIPRYRRGYTYAKRPPSATDQADHLRSIQQMTETDDIIQYMSPRVNPNPDRGLADNEIYAWDFTGYSTYPDHIGIAYRNVPGCVEPGELIAWVALVVYFMITAGYTESSKLKDYTRGIGGLRAFIESGTGSQVDGRLYARLFEAAKNRPDGITQTLRGNRETGGGGAIHSLRG